MKLYNVSIWSNDPFRGMVCVEKTMTQKQKLDATKFAEERIRKFFKWNQQSERFNHLLVWCELKDNHEVVIYNDGYLFTEEEFESKVATRSDLTFVRAYHRR